MLWATLIDDHKLTDNKINIDNIKEVTDKVYVRLIDGAIAWVPTNAHKLGVSRPKIG